MVPQAEAPDEVAARDVVASALGVTLHHADRLGGVDYRFEYQGQSGALEVTRLTLQAEVAAHRAWARRDNEAPHLAPELASSWNVTVEGRPLFRGLARRIAPALAALEATKITSYESADADVLALAERDLAEAVAVLQRECVQHAEVVEFDGPRQILINKALIRKGHGPGPAAYAIQTFIGATEDNLTKLAASNAEQRHLWIWVDDFSPGDVALPFDRPDLPEFPITLPPEVTEVWVYHERATRGWRYSATGGWTALGPMPRGAATDDEHV